MMAYDGLISDMRQTLPLQNEKRDTVLPGFFFFLKTKARKKSQEQELGLEELGHKTTLSDSIVGQKETTGGWQKELVMMFLFLLLSWHFDAQNYINTR